jgi:quercetin dioxygenase-like cupin family protein
MSSTSTVPEAILRAEGEGERRWFFGGGVHTWKVRAHESNGAFLLFEDSMTGGKATPLHTHPDSDETAVVLEGEILMHVDGTNHHVGAGGVAVAPRGVPHAFLVLSASAKILFLHTPGCCEAFYWGASEPMPTDDDLTEGAAEGVHEGVVDFDRVRASAQANGGIVLLGPPPFGAGRAGQPGDG